MPRETSVGRILKNDYASLVLLIFIGVAWLMAALAGAGWLPGRRGGAIDTGGDPDRFMLGLALVITPLFGWLAYRRIAAIRRVVRDGPACVGTVTLVWFMKDRGRVEYEYQFAGQTYQAGNAIMKNRETQTIRQGDRVELIVDPAKPSRAFLASLYVNRG